MSFEIVNDFFLCRHLSLPHYILNTFLLVKKKVVYYSIISRSALDYFYGDCISRPPRSKKVEKKNFFYNLSMGARTVSLHNLRQ